MAMASTCDIFAHDLSQRAMDVLMAPEAVPLPKFRNIDPAQVASSY